MGDTYREALRNRGSSSGGVLPEIKLTRVIVDIKGFEELQKKLTNPEQFLGEPLREYFTKGVGYLQPLAKSLSPTPFTGILNARIRKAIDTAPMPHWGALRSQAPHSFLVEYGSKAHFPPTDMAHARNPKSASLIIVWAQQRGISPFVLARAIGRHGTKGTRFMQRTLESGQAYIDGLVTELASAIEKAWESVK